jgi:hypothetical protein
MRNLPAIVAVLLMTGVPGAAAQTAAPAQAPAAPPTTAAAQVTACTQAQPIVDDLLITALARLETARQTNDPAAMRATIDALQTTLRDARAQLAACANPAAADPHAGHAPDAPAAPKPVKPPLEPPAAPQHRR